MQMAFTFIVAVAGLVLSLTVALLAEELIFRQVLPLFFVRRTVAEAEQKR
jgi:membrane protease YdiL (CAAX protease family)